MKELVRLIKESSNYHKVRGILIQNHMGNYDMWTKDNVVIVELPHTATLTDVSEFEELLGWQIDFKKIKAKDDTLEIYF